MENNNDNKAKIVKVKDISIETLSPYDDNYPVRLLSVNLDKVLGMADEAVEYIYNKITKYTSDIMQIKKATTKDFRFVLDISDGVKKKIASGDLKLTVENGGNTYAQFRNNGKYGKKIPVKKEDFGGKVDPIQMANAMQMRAIQDQLETVTDQLLLIDSSAHQILQGQQNDRIAMYYSGLSLYLEAQNISDEVMKKQILAQSLKTLNEATFQLNLTLKSDIEYLEGKEYEKHKKQRALLIDEKINSISQSFKYIHQAAILRAGIYCQQGELTAMTTVLGEYSKFIADRIAGKAAFLAECDVSDKGIEGTGWKARANLNLDVADIARQIEQKDKVIYLIAEDKIND